MDGNPQATQTTAADISDALPEAIDAPTTPQGGGGGARNLPISAADVGDAANVSGAGPQDDDAALDAVLANLGTGKTRDDLAATYDAARSGKPAPIANASTTATAKETAGAALAGTTPADASAQPAPLAPEARELLGRFQLPDSILAGLDAPQRDRVLANLKDRHDTQARLYQENQRLAAFLKQQQPAANGAPQQQQPQTPADPFAQIDAALAPFLDEGQALSGPLKAALAPVLEQARAAQQRAEASEQSLTHFWRHQEEADKAEGLKAVKIDGVNLDQRTAEGKANHAKLLDTAQRLLNAAQQQEGWSPFAYGWKQAISEASPTVFKAQTILAQRRAAAEQARKTALRGGDPGGLPNRSQPKDSEDVVYDRILDAQMKGATRDELIAIGNGRG